MGLSGLSAATTYKIRVQATNSAGSRLSDTISFTTSSVPNPPALSVSNPTVVGKPQLRPKVTCYHLTVPPDLPLLYITEHPTATRPLAIGHPMSASVPNRLVPLITTLLD